MEQKIRKIDHVVITTENMEKCIAFYEKIGFQAVRTNGRYELFAGDFKINVHEKGKELDPHAARVQPGSGDFCFELEERIENWKENLEKKGIAVYLGIVTRHGVSGEMQSLYLRDPDGNLLEFCSYLEE